MKSVICRVILFSLSMLLISGASYSQTQINGSASGNWSSISSWSPATVPNNGGGNTYNVTLLSSPAVNITLDISPTIDTLTLDSGSILSTDSGTTLTTTGVTNGGDIEFYNGNTLTVNGSMTTSNFIDLDRGSKLIVTGNLTNSGQLFTNDQNGTTAANTITVTGTFTNTLGGNTQIGVFGDTADVMNVGTLVNSGFLEINTGATLNLTNQPNGVTDVASGSEMDIYGTLKAGTANGLAKLNSIEGTLVIGNGQTFTDTPGSGTLTNSNTLDLEEGSNVTVSGNLTNSGDLFTNVRNQGNGKTNTLTVTGTFTNNAGATTHIGDFGDTTDVMNVGTLVNNGLLYIDTGATLNLTNQTNGVTDVVAGSELDVYGTLKAGTANGLAKLGSVEGVLVIGNGQTTADTPGSGTLTLSNSATLDLEEGSTITVTGNLTNSGDLFTNVRNQGNGKTNTLTVTGAFTNNAGATTHIGDFGDTTDVMNVGTLVNDGLLYIDTGATLNLTNQTNGVTDVVAGSELDVYGTLKAGTANGLAKLGSVEGVLVIGNGQTTADTPGSGTLTLSNSATLDLEEGSTLTVTGNLTNSGDLFTNVRNQGNGKTNTLTVTGAFTNNAGATTHIGDFGDTADVMNVATLVNNGFLEVDPGSTLNLTNQANGITDVAQGSQIQDFGSIKAGTANAFAKLGSVEGILVLGSGQTITDTPGSGTLTISNTGELDLELATNLTVSGNLTNSGQLYTNVQNRQGGANTLTVTGTFTNNAGATTHIGDFGDTADVMNVATLVNNGFLEVDPGSTLNLTNQANGITDVAQGSQIQDFGSIKAGTANAFAKLGSVEGILLLGSGQTITDTPSSGTLTISNTGELDLELATNLTVSGNLTNSGLLYTNVQNRRGGANTLTVTGTFTNNTGAVTVVGNFDDTNDVLNVGALSNASNLNIDTGATLAITKAGTSTNTGSIFIGDGSGSATFTINGNTTLTGTTGKVVLSNFANNIIGGTGTLTNVKNTIEGSGNIGNGTMGLNNQGTIDADQSTVLIIDAVGTISNSLTMEATNGATLQLDAGTYSQTAAGTILASGTNSTVNLESGVSITGGKLTLTGTTATIDLVGTDPTLTLSGVAISGTGKLVLPDGSTTTLTGTISNASTIDLNSSGDATKIVIGAASVSLTGAGKIILTPNANNIITGASASDILHSANTIEGAGNIGNGNMGLVNTGTILANSTTLLEIDTSSAGFSNQGTVTVDKGDTLYITGAANSFLNFNSSTSTLTGGTYVVDGTLKFDGANILIDAANITLSGATAKITNQSGTNALTNLNTIASNGTFDITSGITFTTTGNFTNNGSLVVGATSKFIVNSADSLTNFDSGTDTLTGGSYNVTGTLEFAGANIVNNDASITLSGTKALIENQSAVNALTGFDNNETGATFALATKANFTTGPTFTNSGTLNIGAGSIFAVGTNGSGTLTNFSGTTLTGGTYIVAGTLEFNGANIVTNAANITLSGNTYAIKNGTSGNALANFATNSASGNFALTSSAKFTTAGAFSNAGGVTIAKASILTIGGTNNYTQTGGTTQVDGTLTLGSGAALNISAGDLFGNAGTITGTVNASGSAIVDPGDGIGGIGDIKVTQNYTQASSATLDIDIGGTAANTKYDVLDITDAASLNGTLNVALVAGFVPKVNATFTILNYGSETGTFSTVNLPTVAGDHWTVTYNAKDVVLKLVAGAGPTVFADAPLVAANGNGASGSPVAPSTVRANPARWVPSVHNAAITASIAHEPSAILARAETCGGFRTLTSLFCAKEAVLAIANGSVMHPVQSHGTAVSTLHNNVATVSMSGVTARTAASHTSTASVVSLTRLYFCAYLPSTAAHTMGCN